MSYKLKSKIATIVYSIIRTKLNEILKMKVKLQLSIMETNPNEILKTESKIATNLLWK